MLVENKVLIIISKFDFWIKKMASNWMKITFIENLRLKIRIKFI